MDRHYFNPTPNTIYTNKGGGSYICLEAEGHFRAKFQRVSKYTLRNDTAQMGLEVPLQERR